MSKKQTAMLLRTEATPPPDPIETMPEPVKKEPKLFHFPDRQAIVSDEEANSHPDMVVKAWLRDMIRKHTGRTKPDEGGRRITTLFDMNIVDQVGGKNVIHKPELLGPAFEDVLKNWSIKWGVSDAPAEGGNAHV